MSCMAAASQPKLSTQEKPSDAPLPILEPPPKR